LKYKHQKTSQREIEHTVFKAVETETLNDFQTLEIKMMRVELIIALRKNNTRLNKADRGQKP